MFYYWVVPANAQLSTVEHSGRKLSYERKSEPEKLSQMVEQVQEVGAVVKQQKVDLTSNTRHELHKILIHPPLRKIRVTSGWGKRYHPISGLEHFHDGVDLEAYYEPVMAVASGRVTKIGYNDRAGLFIVIEHGLGIQTSYSHLQYSLVKANQIICGGQTLGISGNTGNSTAPHLHFSIKMENLKFNPFIILKDLQ